MLQSGYQAVLETQSRHEFQVELERFTRDLGFTTYTATAVVDHLVGGPEFFTVDNTPAAFRASFQDGDECRRDPVMQHCKTRSVPIIWDQSTYIHADQVDTWEQQARFGYRHGIGLALHMPDGRHFMLGVDRDQALPGDPVEVTRIVAALQLFAVHAQDAAMRVLLPAAAEPGLPALTPRELDTLRWTMEGKTAWEVGNVLGISERTAVWHANNATAKLGCANKHQAVVKALRLGLLR